MRTRTELEKKIEELEQTIPDLRGRIAGLEALKKEHESKIKTAKEQLDAVETFKKALIPFIPQLSQQVSTSAVKGLDIGNQEVVQKITDVPPEVIKFSPTTLEGKVMWAVWKLNKPSGYSEISDYLKEAKKPISDNSLSPTLGSLVKQGNLIREGKKKGTTYRFPKNIRVEAEE